MILLHTIPISDNMYLEGVETATPVIYQQERTVDGGLPSLTIFGNPGGRVLTLGTVQMNGAVQGIWCQSDIDAIKIVQAAGNAVILNYHGTFYNVLITSTAGLKQMFQNEPITPDKKYLGPINLIEV